MQESSPKSVKLPSDEVCKKEMLEAIEHYHGRYTSTIDGVEISELNQAEMDQLVIDDTADVAELARRILHPINVDTITQAGTTAASIFVWG